jgi:hypothetical protein
VWVDTEYPDKSSKKNLQNYTLNSMDLPATSPMETLDASSSTKPTNPSTFFSHYNNLFGLRVFFSSKTPYLEGTPNACSVGIRQEYLFGDYGKHPAHEPGAVLDATRLFPLLRFSFPAVKDSSKPSPKYFRADYRLDINLDNIDISKVLLLKTPSNVPDTTNNKAAIFRDMESTPSLPPTHVRELFAALEKPLAYEIASHGLVEGSPPPGISKLDTWDNLHIWPAKRGGASSPISTPGAFHAVHCLPGRRCADRRHRGDVKGQWARAGTEAQRETAPARRRLQSLAHDRAALAVDQRGLPIVADCKPSQVGIVLPRDLGTGADRRLIERGDLGRAHLSKRGHYYSSPQQRGTSI